VNVLVLNCGSSSLKYRVFDLAAGQVLCGGLVERIGAAESRLRHSWQTADGTTESGENALEAPDHRAALRAIAAQLRATGGARQRVALAAIGHRVVHGGAAFSAPVRINDAVLDTIRRLIPLAPLHNPANLLGIELCREFFPSVPQVAVFDTAFHQSMPPCAYRYAVPETLYREHAVRRYGFHGSSHAFVLRRVAQQLGCAPETLNLISLHLGNGASAAAIRDGRSVDTSMGMTPLEGLVMGTRAGDLDPALPFFIERVTGSGSLAVDDLLNRDSGLRGLCGSSDMREVLQRAADGDAAAELALDVYCYRVRKYIGAYFAVLGRVDAIAFTAGVGENAPAVRARICRGLEAFGVRLDLGRNASAAGAIVELQTEAAPVRLLMVRTNEELEIAEQSRAVLQIG
jgi:acetate kinase